MTLPASDGSAPVQSPSHHKVAHGALLTLSTGRCQGRWTSGTPGVFTGVQTVLEPFFLGALRALQSLQVSWTVARWTESLEKTA